MQAEPTLRQLRHFLSLAEHCHFGHAAEACLITQSSLSASIKELETVLGASLFERTNRTVMPTALGRDMVGLAKAVLSRVDDLVDAARGAGRPLCGDLAMGVIPTIGPFLLPRVLPRLRDAHPELRLFLREEQTEPLLRRLADGALDLVLMALPYATENLECFTFADDPFMAVFPRGHALGEYETMTPGRLAGEDVLALEVGNCLSEHTLSFACPKNGAGTPGRHAPQANRYRATSLHTLVQMVANGLGVTVLPKMAIDADILRGLNLDFRPFSSPRASRRIALAWRKSSTRGDEFRLLGTRLRDELGTPLHGK